MLCFWESSTLDAWAAANLFHEQEGLWAQHSSQVWVPGWFSIRSSLATNWGTDLEVRIMKTNLSRVQFLNFLLGGSRSRSDPPLGYWLGWCWRTSGGWGVLICWLLWHQCINQLPDRSRSLAAKLKSWRVDSLVDGDWISYWVVGSAAGDEMTVAPGFTCWSSSRQVVGAGPQFLFCYVWQKV